MPEPSDPNDSPVEEKQCRICLDGPEAVPELGRLIKPCLCKGSISYVHVKCLQRWRNTSQSRSQFFSCPMCKYQYRFARTKIFGVATNPVVIGGISAVFFTIIVFLSSFVTTYFMNALQEPSYSVVYSSYFYTSPLEMVQELVRATLRILRDGNGDGILDDPSYSKVFPVRGDSDPNPLDSTLKVKRGILRHFVRRFVLGLPVVGAGSLVHMLLSVPVLGPVHWLARYRGNRRRENSRDIAALLIIALIAIGAARALYKVYTWTQSLTKRLLLRAEDAILEVY